MRFYFFFGGGAAISGAEAEATAPSKWKCMPDGKLPGNRRKCVRPPKKSKFVPLSVTPFSIGRTDPFLLSSSVRKKNLTGSLANNSVRPPYDCPAPAGGFRDRDCSNSISAASGEVGSGPAAVADRATSSK